MTTGQALTPGLSLPRPSRSKGQSRVRLRDRKGQGSSKKLCKPNVTSPMPFDQPPSPLCPRNVVPLLPLEADLPDSPASPTPIASPLPPSHPTSTSALQTSASSPVQLISPSSSLPAFPPFNPTTTSPSPNPTTPRFNDFFSEMCTRLIRITAVNARQPLQNMLKQIGIKRGMLDAQGRLSRSPVPPYTDSDFTKCDLEVLRAWRLCTMQTVMSSPITRSRSASPMSSVGSSSPPPALSSSSLSPRVEPPTPAVDAPLDPAADPSTLASGGKEEKIYTSAKSRKRQSRNRNAVSSSRSASSPSKPPRANDKVLVRLFTHLSTIYNQYIGVLAIVR